MEPGRFAAADKAKRVCGTGIVPPARFFCGRGPEGGRRTAAGCIAGKTFEQEGPGMRTRTNEQLAMHVARVTIAWNLILSVYKLIAGIYAFERDALRRGALRVGCFQHRHRDDWGAARGKKTGPRAPLWT